MADYSVTIQNSDPAYKLYQKLKANGVKDADLDTGYPQTDYVKKTRKTINNNDRKIDRTEVLNYALEHYERYQLAIKQTTGYDVPWSLDDLNPATHFDQGLREQIDHAIAAFKKILAAKKINEGTPRHDELMALSLYAFTLAGIPRMGLLTPSVSMPKYVLKPLKGQGLTQVIDYLTKFGGLGFWDVDKRCERRATGIEALIKSCGVCEEQSSVVFGVLRRAGLRPGFLFVIPLPGKLYNNKYRVNMSVLHKSVVLNVNNRKMLFDPTMNILGSEADYRRLGLVWWFEETGSEALADYHSDLSADMNTAGKYDLAITDANKALELNPYAINAFQNLADGYSWKNDYDQMLKYVRAEMKIAPGLVQAHYALGTAYLNKGENDRAIAELEIAMKMAPGSYEIFRNLSDAYNHKNEYARAAKALKRALQLNPDNAQLHNKLAKVYGLDGIQLERAKQLDRAVRQFRMALAEYQRAEELGAQIDQEEKELWQELKNNVSKYESIRAGLPAQGLSRAEEYYLRNELSLALVAYKKVAQANPRDAAAFLGIWNVYKAMGDQVKAASACEQYKKVSHSRSVSCRPAEY